MDRNLEWHRAVSLRQPSSCHICLGIVVDSPRRIPRYAMIRLSSCQLNVRVKLFIATDRNGALDRRYRTRVPSHGKPAVVIVPVSNPKPVAPVLY